MCASSPTTRILHSTHPDLFPNDQMSLFHLDHYLRYLHQIALQHHEQYSVTFTHELTPDLLLQATIGKPHQPASYSPVLDAVEHQCPDQLETCKTILDAGSVLYLLDSMKRSRDDNRLPTSFITLKSTAEHCMHQLYKGSRPTSLPHFKVLYPACPKKVFNRLPHDAHPFTFQGLSHPNLKQSSADASRTSALRIIPNETPGFYTLDHLTYIPNKKTPYEDWSVGAITEEELLYLLQQYAKNPLDLLHDVHTSSYAC